MSHTTTTLPVREQTVLEVSALLHAQRRRRGTRAGTRVLSCYWQAVLVVRWLLDDTRVAQLAGDNRIGRSTCYEYLHEALGVLAEQAPGLHSALLAAKMAGYDYVIIDGALVETDRCRTPEPTVGVDLWWSGEHEQHGANVQVITAPDGWPLSTSEVRPGREHDTTALREHTEVLPLLRTWTDHHGRVLGDLGHEGEAGTITVGYKKPAGGTLSGIQKTYNKVHNGLRAIGERRNSLLKTTFRALRNVSVCPWRIGTIVAAALVVLHLEHDRTT